MINKSPSLYLSNHPYKYPKSRLRSIKYLRGMKTFNPKDAKRKETINIKEKSN